MGLDRASGILALREEQVLEMALMVVVVSPCCSAKNRVGACVEGGCGS